MFLDIGLIGVVFYIYYFIQAWKSDKQFLLGLESKLISFKLVILITFLAFVQYEHINGNVRGMLFWFLILSEISKNNFRKII